MASTLTPTSFIVDINEKQIVRNQVIESKITYTIEDVTNVDRRIVTCPNTTSIDLFNINGINPGAGTFPSSSLKYSRISNLDDTYCLAVTYSSSQGEYTQELKPESSLFLVSSNMTSSNFNGSFNDDLLYVKVYAVSSSIDVEYTLVNA